MIRPTLLLALATALWGAKLAFKVKSHNDAVQNSLPSGRMKMQFHTLDTSVVAPEALVVTTGSGDDPVAGKYLGRKISKVLLDYFLKSPGIWNRLSPQVLAKKLNEQVAGAISDLRNSLGLWLKDIFEEDQDLQPGLLGSEVFGGRSSLAIANIATKKDSSKLNVIASGNSRVAVFSLQPNPDLIGRFYDLRYLSPDVLVDRSLSQDYTTVKGEEIPEQLTAVTQVELLEGDVVVAGSSGLFDRLPVSLMALIINLHIHHLIDSEEEATDFPKIFEEIANSFKNRVIRESQTVKEILRELAPNSDLTALFPVVQEINSKMDNSKKRSNPASNFPAERHPWETGARPPKKMVHRADHQEDSSASIFWHDFALNMPLGRKEEFLEELPKEKMDFQEYSMRKPDARIRDAIIQHPFFSPFTDLPESMGKPGPGLDPAGHPDDESVSFPRKSQAPKETSEQIQENSPPKPGNVRDSKATIGKPKLEHRRLMRVEEFPLIEDLKQLRIAGLLSLNPADPNGNDDLRLETVGLLDPEVSEFLKDHFSFTPEHLMISGLRFSAQGLALQLTNSANQLGPQKDFIPPRLLLKAALGHEFAETQWTHGDLASAAVALVVNNDGEWLEYDKENEKANLETSYKKFVRQQKNSLSNFLHEICNVNTAGPKKSDQFIPSNQKTHLPLI